MHNNRNSVTRYSILTQDRKPDSVIIDKMSKRLLTSNQGVQGECFEGQYNKVIVWDNINNTQLGTI